MLWFEIYSTDHNEILHTSRQLYCRDVWKISLWSVQHILNQSTPNFDRISNSIEIPLVGLAPEQNIFNAKDWACLMEYTRSVVFYSACVFTISLSPVAWQLVFQEQQGIYWGVNQTGNQTPWPRHNQILYIHVQTISLCLFIVVCILLIIN